MPKAFQGKYTRTIYEWFIAPLHRYREHDIEPVMWNEFLFNVKEVSLDVYLVRTPFLIPGLFHQAANIKTQGMGERKTKRGELVYVREDVRAPDIVELERPLVGPLGSFHEDDLNRTNWFTLSRLEWNRIRPHLELTRLSAEEEESDAAAD